MEFLILIDNTLNQTLIYSFLALSVYISLLLLDYPDLSIEGTFPMGAAISASIATYTGFLSLSIPIAIIFGFLINISFIHFFNAIYHIHFHQYSSLKITIHISIHKVSSDFQYQFTSQINSSL